MKFLVIALLGALASAAGGGPVVAAGQAGAVDKAGEWTELFNGKDLEGWVSRGLPGVFKVEKGEHGNEIVGTTLTGRENTFLCTTRDYGDFVLELEYKCPEIMNSGVQIRSAFNPEMRRVELKGVPPLPGKPPGKVFASPNHVYGYQVEIEFPRGRNAGIYDEARRNGWVFPQQNTQQDRDFVKQGLDRTLFKPGQWQKLRIEAQGDRIITYLDGVKRADVRDTASATGFIALQVHSSQSKRDIGLQVHFRNIRIQEGLRPAVALPAPAVRD
ncbi:MAG: DUF1080 domain-containing protein [Puniceicoccales bacterium]|jgi:hypothetical protein|nr:DUF1080 domain-containing protein [Puniceicoccales bacterium]